MSLEPPAAGDGRADRQPLTARGQDKRERIIDAAGALLAERGYAGTTLRDIAEAADTHAGSLYYHFANREELATEVLLGGARAALEHTRAMLDVLPDTASARRRLEVAIEAHVEFMLARSPAALASARAIGQLPPTIAERMAEVHRAYGRLFATLFEAAAAEGSIDSSVDLSAARMLVLGAANFTTEWFDPSGSHDAEGLAALISRMTFDGLGPATRAHAEPG